jgi:hypothetical protein
MDLEVRGGMGWTDELLEAVGTCQVLIALLSPRFLASEWCGKEWSAFSQRQVRALEASQGPERGCIVPVLWTPPVPDLSRFGPASEIQVFSPDSTPDPALPDRYRNNGIYGLLRTGQVDSYQIIVWQLALFIAKLYHNQLAEVRTFRTEELQSAFPGSRS